MHTAVPCLSAEPAWTDIKFGVFICIECSGIHRGLGAHLAQVKSLTLDEFSDENVTVSRTGTRDRGGREGKGRERVE